MIHIKEDKSYLTELDFEAIATGFAELGIHSLNFDRYYTEEQKKINAESSKTMTSEQWSEHCEQVRIGIGNKIKNIIDAIDKELIIYQYHNKDINYSLNNWDLFFWCNWSSDRSELDMSYVTLNPNKSRTNEHQLKTINTVLELIKRLEINGIQVRIQYKAIYNESKVNEATQEYCNKIKDQFIDYNGYIGKIVEFNGRYVFKKKGAKKNAYELNNKSLLVNVLKASV